MNSSTLVFIVALLITIVTSAPYVQHLEQEPEQRTDLNSGPEKTKLEPSASSMLRELFGFMDVLMDPQNYSVDSNVQVCIYFKILDTFSCYGVHMKAHLVGFQLSPITCKSIVKFRRYEPPFFCLEVIL